MSKSVLHDAYSALLSRGRLKANSNQAALIDRLAILQTQLSSSPQSLPGLYIYGSVGTGKSRLADLFAATLPSGVSKRRTHFHEFMLDIHKRLHQARSAPGFAGDPLLRIGHEVAAESRLLCFDEFQVSDIADAMILKRLFGAIWAGGGVMVSTSNRHPDQLYENGLNRPLFLPFIEDLKRRCAVWRLQGEEDYRLSPTSEREEVFFTDRAAFEVALVQATEEEAFSTLVIPVMMNRALQVQAYTSPTGRTIVSSSFADLFQRNLGAADYHALCATANTVFVSGLRQFHTTELDYVRRLITLIDLAYETKTKVIILSDDPLTELFKKVAPSVQPQLLESLSVRKEGGSSSSMMSTFIGETEWSATGLKAASLATGGAGETDVRFAIGRAVSRLSEMGRRDFGMLD